MMVSAQIDAHLPALTPAERKVAAVGADAPEAVAFGTVADVARRAGASGATVVRLSAKLGFDGFVELQAAVREEMARRLRPASERIRRPAPGDVLGSALAVEMANVAATLEGVDPAAFDEAVALLSGPPPGSARRPAGAGARAAGGRRLGLARQRHRPPRPGRVRLAHRRRPDRLRPPSGIALHRGQHHRHDRAGLLGLPGLVGGGPGEGPLDVDVDAGTEGGGAGEDREGRL